MTSLFVTPRALPVPDSPLLAAERPQDAPAVDALIDAAFGPGRFVKAAERLRENNRFLPDLSFTAHAGGVLVGGVRLWPIWIGARGAVFLGPIAVDPAWRSRGLGAALVEKACEASRAAGHDLVLLVGDQPFFGPLGFSMVPPGRIVLPGPADPSRVLARALVPGLAEGFEGVVRA
ncbi:MAG TPA: N-acetyltransferase [Caulobacteraceae bacterium]|jgi:predicted N-acetyltransferase YhbS|nr:N-acetyltransferase [Caulobacteraceae bacterium]